MRKILFCFLLSACALATIAQQARSAVSGRVSDAATGEALPAVTVTVVGTLISTSTNIDGHFVLSGLTTGVLLRFTCIGYRTHEIEVELGATDLIIQLTAEADALGEVVVTGESAQHFKANEHVGMIRLNPRLIATLPSLGEKDIFRAFQLMPGVSAGNEQSAGLYVRGGTPDQNLVLFDGFTVYNVDHLFGFFSAFNAHAIKDVQLFKGGFDAQYGGRLSALMDITGKEGSKAAFNAGVDVGFLSVNGFVETPIGEHISVFAGYRRSFGTSFYDKLKNQATIDNQRASRNNGRLAGIADRLRGEADVQSWFDDLNTKLTYRTDGGDVFSWSVYHGKDHMDNSIQAGSGWLGRRISSFLSNTTDVAAWGNTGTSLKWSRQWTPALYSNTLVSYSHYFSERDNTVQGSITDSLGVERVFRSGTIEDNRLHDYAARTDWEWAASAIHRLGFGIQYSYQDIGYRYARNDTLTLVDRASAGHTLAAYAEDELSLINHRLHIVPGIRVTAFSPTGRVYLEPRLRAEYRLTDRIKAKGTAGQYNQFAKRVVREDLLRGSRDFWLLADDGRIPVSFSRQYSAGISWENGHFLIDAEVYVKKMDGLSEYTFRFQPQGGGADYADFFYEGTGLAKGIDFLLQKKVGRYNGWVGYTLAEVINRFDAYGEEAFAAANDIRNEFKMVHNYRLGRFDLSLSWFYMTGKPYTAPTGGYQITLLDGTRQTYLNVSEKNALRLPAYHRLDAAVTLNFGRPGKFNGTLGLSLFNLYNRTNIWYKNFDIMEDEIVETDVNYLGFTPNLSLSIKLN
ncbi:TonB-dependent receptor [Parapedobacter pyrenivorans]|uniref:TonB-dependent receptor n=1 Tax=Parapedobacter pyrenivorans TaxID=1305674 RepID=UPI003341414B